MTMSETILLAVWFAYAGGEPLPQRIVIIPDVVKCIKQRKFNNK